MIPILQKSLPVSPWMQPHTRRMPGTQPLDPAQWLMRDDAYAEQMALRDRLIADSRDLVHAHLPQADDAAAELYQKVIREDLPRHGFLREGDRVTRPDGVVVTLDPDLPMVTLGRLFQEDFLILQDGDGFGEAGEHVLTSAILCFPAGWTLAEKIGRAMMRIHKPVDYYTDDIGRRVQRLMDGVQPDRPIWRANYHLSRAPLFNPQPEEKPKDRASSAMHWLRSERQCLARLPQSRAIVFTVHTFIVDLDSLTPEQAEALRDHPPHTA